VSARIRRVVRRNHWRHELQAARRHLGRITVDGHAQAEAWRAGEGEPAGGPLPDGVEGFAVEVPR
jgi:hypothetical protein